MFPLRPRTPHRTMSYLAVPLLTVLFLLCAVPANAEKEHQAEGKISAAEYFADLLKEEEPEGATCFYVMTYLLHDRSPARRHLCASVR